MWVQLCVHCDTVFARATKTHWCCPCDSNNMLVISAALTGINHNTKADQLSGTPRGRHTKCSVLHSGQNNDNPQIGLVKYISLIKYIKLSIWNFGLIIKTNNCNQSYRINCKVEGFWSSE